MKLTSMTFGNSEAETAYRLKYPNTNASIINSFIRESRVIKNVFLADIAVDSMLDWKVPPELVQDLVHLILTEDMVHVSLSTGIDQEVATFRFTKSGPITYSMTSKPNGQQTISIEFPVTPIRPRGKDE